ncbi:MAG: hypothetical protein M3270_02295 [Thermoproteota archaeon]|nr:hypothetical protein [Thermoproteota archaeon]
MASSEDHDDIFRIKAGASLLAKGGTLTSEPCSKCKGVQVRIGDKTTCINCGNEVITAPNQSQVEREKNTTTAREPVALASATTMIEEKIVMLASEIRDEDEIFLLKEKAELLERYVGILERLKALCSDEEKRNVFKRIDSSS